MPLRKVRNLRAVKPGQWVRTRIPDYECWRKPGEWTGPMAGKVVEVCIIPTYRPRITCSNYFEWDYMAAYRHHRDGWLNFYMPDGGHIWPANLGMEAAYKAPEWDSDEYHAYRKGQGVFVYEPAGDRDEDLGPDRSLYLCDTCGKYKMPWSDDDGNLLCRDCEVTGLVIRDDQIERLEQAREFARQMGISQQLEQQLNRMAGGTFFGRRSQCVLSSDFAPHSFSFAHYILPEGEEKDRRTGMVGGLIFQGPGLPADGSFPSLTVSLASGTGWFCHT